MNSLLNEKFEYSNMVSYSLMRLSYKKSIVIYHLNKLDKN